MERLGKWFGLTSLLAALVLASPASALAQGWRGAPAGGAHAAPPAGGAHMGGGYHGHPGGGYYGGIPRGAPIYGHGYRGGPVYRYGYTGPYYGGSAFVGYPGYYWGWPGYGGWNGGVRVYSGSSYVDAYGPSPGASAQYPGWVWVQGRWLWGGTSWVWNPGHWSPAGS